MNDAVIEIRQLCKRFGERVVLDALDLTVFRGEALFLIGTSGVGKSVTIKHLVGLLHADSGEIFFDGQRIDELDEEDFYPIRARMALVFQQAPLFDAMTLRQNVAVPLRVHKRMGYRDAQEEAGRRLRQVHLEDYADHYPGQLGDGIRKRAAVARALAMDPEVVLLDEPTTGLDPVSARRIDGLVRELVDKLGVTAVVVSHDLESITHAADRVAFLYQGRIHALGTPDELRNSDDPAVRQFLAGHSHGPMETPGF